MNKTPENKFFEDLIPNEVLSISLREIHALLQYMNFTFSHEGEGIDDFFVGFSDGDDAVWDEEATRSIYAKLLQKSNYFYSEGFLPDVDS